MTADDALTEGYDVFVADDTTSFLSAGFVADLQRRSVAVVGVFDPDEAEGSGKQRLLDLQVDDVIEADASPAEFLRALARCAAGSLGDNGDGFSALVADLAEPDMGRRDPFDGPVGGPHRGRLIVVAGASGGVGTTEVAIGLSTVLAARSQGTVLLDADDVGPSVAQRLNLEVHPNLRTAIDMIHNRSGTLENSLIEMPAGGFEVLGGLANRRDWFELRPVDVSETVLELARMREYIIVNVSSRLEDLPAVGGPARYGVTRSMLALADVVVLVAAPTPVGVARVLDWIAEAQSLIEATPLFVVFNAFNGGTFKAAEVDAELRHVYQPRSVLFVPHDKGLAHATWQGVLPGRGPFLKGMETLAMTAAPSPRATRKHRRTR
jgi:MinD-like ATPase involved in chromosome partitioning or flagellar assembly